MELWKIKFCIKKKGHTIYFSSTLSIRLFNNYRKYFFLDPQDIAKRQKVPLHKTYVLVEGLKEAERWGRGVRGHGWCLNIVVRVGFILKITSDPRLEGRSS